MVRRCVLMAAIAILIAGVETFAQNQGRQEKIEFTMEIPHQVLGSCGEVAAVIATVDLAITQTFHRDKHDQVVSVTTQYRTIQPSIYYLGDPVTFVKIPDSNVAMGVPGETQIDKLDFVNMAASSRGSIYQVTVPGYGRLFSETGLTVSDPSTWTILLNRGHNDVAEQHVAALCDYLSGR